MTACASGTNAIGDAFRRIKYGNEKFMIAGGAEAAVTPLALSGFAAMRACQEGMDAQNLQVDHLITIEMDCCSWRRCRCSFS